MDISNNYVWVQPPHPERPKCECHDCTQARREERTGGFTITYGSTVTGTAVEDNT